MSCNCQEVAEKGKNKVEESFAKELLKGYSAQAHRWFIAFIVVLIMWFSTIGMFIWYLNQPIEETTTETVTTSTIDQDSANNNSITGVDIN
nr:MAG TPA: hypothetical protein [Caudoviricetes sp.]